MTLYPVAEKPSLIDRCRGLVGLHIFQERMPITDAEKGEFVQYQSSFMPYVSKIWTPAGGLLVWDLGAIDPELSSETDPRVYGLILNGISHIVAELPRNYFTTYTGAANARTLSFDERLFAFGNERAEDVLEKLAKNLKIPEIEYYQELIRPHVKGAILKELLHL